MQVINVVKFLDGACSNVPLEGCFPKRTFLSFREFQQHHFQCKVETHAAFSIFVTKKLPLSCGDDAGCIYNRVDFECVHSGKRKQGVHPGSIRMNILNNLESCRKGCPAAILLRCSAGCLRITTARIEHNHALSTGLAKYYVKKRKIPSRRYVFDCQQQARHRYCWRD